MPYKVKHVKGSKKPWKILRYKNGKWEQIGESETEADARASIRARLAAKYGK